MEVLQFETSIQKILAKHPGLDEFFNEEELLDLTREMLAAVEDVAEQHNIVTVEFTDDETMCFWHQQKKVTLGLGNVMRMIEVWSKKLDYEKGDTKKLADVRRKVIETLRADAAHEAGHSVIDRSPIELGFSIQEWNQTGLHYMGNAVHDCRNDNRIMDQEPHLKEDMVRAMEYGFSEGGRLAWAEKAEEDLDLRGAPSLFSQFGAEAIRSWMWEEIHPKTDPRVQELLEKERWMISYLAKNKACVPKRRPGEVEVREKGRKINQQVLDMYHRGYKALVERDIENQSIHQALGLLGLKHIEIPIHPEIDKILDEEIEKAPDEILAELHEFLIHQRDRKLEEMDLDINEEGVKKEVEGVLNEVTEDADSQGEIEEKATGDMSDDPTILNEDNDDAGVIIEDTIPKDINGETDKVKTSAEHLERALLGPAILVEDLSDELREWLLKLFEKVKEKGEEIQKYQQLMKMIKDLLGDPEQVIRDLEDELSEKIRPHTAPATSPNHAELDEELKKEQENPPPTPPPPDQAPEVMPGNAGSYLLEGGSAQDAREFPKIENWLDENANLPDKKAKWRKAIRSMRKIGTRVQTDPTTDSDMEAIVDNVIKKTAGQVPEWDVFEEAVMEQEKVALSVLWRTANANMEDSMRLFLFLKRIYEDPEIFRYLDLEILLSQNVPGIPQDDDGHIPVVIGFGKDPIRDHEEIMRNLHTLAGGGGFAINQDATALKVQRERMLKKSSSKSRKKFIIDCWDEAAIQAGVPDAMQAVFDEVKATKEALNAHNFCIVISGGSGQQAKASYGPDNYVKANNAIELIDYLDIVVRCMIKYQDNYAAHIREMVKEELGITLK